MSVILCRKEKATHPFFIENLGIHIYTSQELCYAVYQHPLLALDGFIDQNLIDFIREELDMGFAALKLERWLQSGENPDELLFLLLQECDYYSSLEISRLRQKVTALRKLPPLEYAKNKADYLFGFKQYGRAIAGYEKILESFLAARADDSFLGKVWNKLGACYARIFQFDRAMQAYEVAYDKLKSPEILEKLYHLTLLNPACVTKWHHQSAVTKEQTDAWDRDFEQARENAGRSEELLKVQELFKKDPIRREEGARQMLANWKQEYRGMA